MCDNLGRFFERDLKRGFIPQFHEDLEGGPHSFIARFQMMRDFKIMEGRGKEGMLQCDSDDDVH